MRMNCACSRKLRTACSTTLPARSRRIGMPPQRRRMPRNGQRKRLCLPNQRALTRSTNLAAMNTTKSQFEVWCAPIITNLSSAGSCPSTRQPMSFSTPRPRASANGLGGRKLPDIQQPRFFVSVARAPCAAMIVRGSALATPAIHAGALAELHFLQGAAALLAELARAPVDEQLLLEIAGLAVAADEVAQGGAAALDGDRQDALDLRGQALVARPGNRAGGLARIDAGGEQRLAGVDVADADHHRVVHDERLHRHAPAPRQLEQPGAVERLGERLRPQLAQQ